MDKDTGLFDRVRTELFTAVIGDVLDRMGLLHQFLPATIAPLRPEMVVVGRAMPVLEADYPNSEGAGGAAPGRGPLAAAAFGLMLEALDDLGPGEVYLAGTGGLDYALWGELMTLRARRCGAAGAVLWGYHRDTAGILEQDWPVFSTGAYAQDQSVRGKVLDWRTPVRMGQVLVRPGDLVVGDRDGVLVVPREAEDEALARATEKVRSEKTVARAIDEGMPAAEAFRRFGVM